MRWLDYRNHLKRPHICVDLVAVSLVRNADHLVWNLNNVRKCRVSIRLERGLYCHHHWLVLSLDWNHLSIKWHSWILLDYLNLRHYVRLSND